MEIPLYLSMTATEFAHCRKFPAHTAWMACHFSPYGTGLTNLPAHLPKKSLIIVNDRTPIHRHDPMQIRQALEEIISNLDCSGVLLDFQRSDSSEAIEIINTLLALPCPVCVSDIYAKELDCPVFLPPIPITATPEEYLAPWKDREIWLDAAPEDTVFTVNKTGCQRYPCNTTDNFPFHDEQLCCHYRIEPLEGAVRFHLRRTKEDVAELLTHCTAFGVTTGVGLWQELA